MKCISIVFWYHIILHGENKYLMWDDNCITSFFPILTFENLFYFAVKRHIGKVQTLICSHLRLFYTKFSCQIQGWKWKISFLFARISKINFLYCRLHIIFLLRFPLIIWGTCLQRNIKILLLDVKMYAWYGALICMICSGLADITRVLVNTYCCSH